MSLNKQAKIISQKQEKIILSYLKTTRYPTRNKVVFLLSIKAGFRAKEIASLTWGMCTDAQGHIGHFISLEDIAAKGASGRKVPINKALKKALVELKKERHRLLKPSHPVVLSERGNSFSAQAIVNFFHDLYKSLGFSGCSSHSGRRTFVTRLAQNISKVDGSLRDVQVLAGHVNLQSTQRYIEHDKYAIKKVVDLI